MHKKKIGDAVLLSLFICISKILDVFVQAYLFLCVEVLWPSQPNEVMLSTVSVPNHTFTEQA